MADGMGGFVAGSIVAKLLLDKTEWNQSVQAVGKDQKNLAESAQKIGESFKEVGIKLAAAGAVITAVFSTMIHKTSQYGDKLDEISQRTGVSVEALSGLRLAAEKNSVSIEALANGFKFLSMNMVEAASGAGDGAKLFNALGISVKDSTGKLKDSSAVMIEVADVFAGMEDGATKTALAVKLFGRAGMDMIPILNLGSKGLKEQRDLAEKLGITFTKDSAKGAANFRDSLVDLKASAEGIGKEIAMSLMPTVNNLVKAVTSVVIKMREWMGAHPGVTQALSLTGLAIGGVLTGMGAFIFTIGTLVQKLSALSTAMGVARLSILATTGVIAGAITAVVIYAAKLMELKVAEDYVNEADKRLQEGENKLVESLSKAAVAADWQYGRMSKLIEAYHGNIAALAMAIQKGKEGKDIQEALAKVGKEENAVIEEQRKKLGALGDSILDSLKKQKTWGEVMKEYGIIPIKEKQKEIITLLGYENQLNQMLRNGEIDSKEYGQAIVELNKKLEELGSSTANHLIPALSKLGLITAPEAQRALELLKIEHKDLVDAFKNRLIDLIQFNDGIKKLDDQAKELPGNFRVFSSGVQELGRGFTATILPARDLSGALEILRTEALKPDYFADQAYECYGFSAALKFARDNAALFGVSIRTDLIASLKKLEKGYKDLKASGQLGKIDEIESVEKLIELYKQLGLKVPSEYKKMAFAAKLSTKDMSDYFVGLYNDIATGLGTAIQDFITGWSDAEKQAIRGIRDSMSQLKNEFDAAQDALDQKYKDGLISEEDYLNQSKILLDDYNKAYKKLTDDMGEYTTGFEKLWKSVWESIKTAFFRAIGEMMAEWTLKFIKKILFDLASIKPAADAAAKAASEAGTVAGSGLSSGISAGVSSALSAIGMIVGAFSAFISLINILSTMKKLTAIERAEFDRAYEEMQRKAGVIVAPSTGRKRTEEETEPNQDGGWQTGFHGIVSSPIRPLIGEVPERVDITPLSKLSHMTVEKNKKERPIEIHNEVHIQGQIITDREYVRYRLIPEIISAMDSHYKKSQLQASLGVG